MIATDGIPTIANAPRPSNSGLDPKVERLARALAAARGITLEQARRVLMGGSA